MPLMLRSRTKPRFVVALLVVEVAIRVTELFAIGTTRGDIALNLRNPDMRAESGDGFYL